MDEKPNYFAVIPANVRYDTELRANAKLMYGEITALSSKYGECTASNNYFAKLYEVDSSAISKWITQLKNKNYIEVEYETKGKEIERRIIKIIGIDKYQYVLPKEQEGYCQKNKENNTSNNITSNKKEIYKERKFKKPTLIEVEEYCKERNNEVDPQKFIDFYESKGWLVGKSPMKDWKACIRTWEQRSAARSTPKWFNEDSQTQELSKEDLEEMERILNVE
jgi:hypothetical protein